MSDENNGSQSRLVVLLASFFITMMSLGSAYIVYTGPDPESVFGIFRRWYLFYPIMICSTLLFGRFAVMGFKKFLTMPKQ